MHRVRSVVILEVCDWSVKYMEELQLPSTLFVCLDAAVYVVHVCVSGQTSKLCVDVAECGGSSGGSRGPSELLHRAAQVRCNQEHKTRLRPLPLCSFCCLHQAGVPLQAECLPDKVAKHAEVCGSVSYSTTVNFCT